MSMFYPVFAAAVKFKSGSLWNQKKKRYAKTDRACLRDIHTRMSGAYFHKGISRLRAEELLLAARDDGSFLVRDSETLNGAYVLCLLHQSRVHQYRILPGPDGKLSVQSEGDIIDAKYKDLNELVADYVHKREKNGLISALKSPIAPEKSSDDVDTDDDEFEDIANFSPVTSPNTKDEIYESQSQRIQVELLKNFSKLDLSNFDGEFNNLLKNYVEKGIERDVLALKRGESIFPDFQRILEDSAKGLQRELDKFMKKVSVFCELLNIPEINQTRKGRRTSKGGNGIPSMLEKMSECRADIIVLENKVQETLRLFSVSQYDYIDINDDEDNTLPEISSPFLSSLYVTPHIPRSNFEVKLLKHGKTAMKITLSIDIQAGKLFAVKPSKESLDSKSVFTPDRILQLVKSTKDMSRLDVIINNNKKYTYSFGNVHTRENFCQQIMQMKNLHSAGDNVDQISVFIGTWNMGDSLPHNSINSWLKCSGCGKPRETEILGCLPHDLYVVGTQESAMTEKDWVNFLKNHLKSCVMADLEVVEVCTLWGIRLVILTKKQYQHSISRIQRSTVRTGIANALGNKGAVGISFYFRGTSFCFINAHLTSGDERIERRNQNYRDILKGLSLGQKHLDLFGITNQFHHVFWLGDLNYRVEDKIQTILTKLTEKDIQYLLSKDQLKKTQGEKKGFCGFNEAEISFMPTYRLPRSEVCWRYDWKKVKKTGERINAPSWCDRVLWRSYPGTYIENTAYGCAESVLGSDHRPVFASFNIGITSDFVMNRDSLIEADSPVKIVFQQVEAQVRTCCKQHFQLEFHSSCFSEVITSKPNHKFADNRTGLYCCPIWTKHLLTEIRPLFGDQEFLEEQHILIAVRTKDGDHESYGECVVPLKNTFDLMPQEFEYQLLHQGEVTGKLKGQMHVLSGKHLAARRNSKKSYELIALDTEYIDPTTWHPDSPNFTNKLDGSISVINRNRSPQHSTLTTTKSVPILSEDRPPAVIPRDVLEDSSSRPYVNVGPGVGGGNSIRPKVQPYMGQASLQATQRQVLPVSTSSNRLDECTTPPEVPPPPLPKKRGPSYVNVDSQSPSKKYDQLKRPSSVVEWLNGLSLSEYVDNFIKNGFDSISFISNISRSDLVEIGVDNSNHRDRIINSLDQIDFKS